MKRVKRIVVLAAVLLLSLSFGLFVSAAPQSYSFKVSSTAQYGILDHKDGTAATIVSRSNNGWSCFEKWTIRQRDLSYLWYSKSGPYYTFQPGYKYKFTMELLCLRSYAAISNGTLTLKAGSTVIGKYVPVIEDSSSGYRIMRYDVELTVSSSMAWDSFIFDFTCIPTGTIEFAVTDNVYITSVDPNQEIVDGIVDEDYGYTPPTNPNMDNGLEAGGDLLDQMTDTIDDFNANINANTQVLIQNVNKVKPVLDGVFGVIPLPVTATITGVVVFLVLRKVVGR